MEAKSFILQELASFFNSEVTLDLENYGLSKSSKSVVDKFKLPHIQSKYKDRGISYIMGFEKFQVFVLRPEYVGILNNEQWNDIEAISYYLNQPCLYNGIETLINGMDLFTLEELLIEIYKAK